MRIPESSMMLIFLVTKTRLAMGFEARHLA